MSSDDAAGITVDFHNHLIPGVDDGAQDSHEAAAALRVLASEGIRDLIAGVHLEASLAEAPEACAARLAEIDRGFAQLSQLAREHAPQVRLHRGAEVKLDTPRPDFSDARFRLAGTRFVLVEFAGLEVPAFGPELIGYIVASGWRPIVAHPERYRGSENLVATAHPWVEAGAALQLNHGSLSGQYGKVVQDHAVALLKAGLISYVSTDFHARHRTWIAETLGMIASCPEGPLVIATLETNAQRLLRDEAPVPCPPLVCHRGGFGRFRSLAGRLVPRLGK